MPPYPVEKGGFVCNIAIERRATAVFDPGVQSAHGSTPASSVLGNRFNDINSPLAEAALRSAGISGARIVVTSDFPVGAGLGGSSAAGVAIAGAISHFLKRDTTPSQIAEWSREVEVSHLGVPGGYQDHYAAALGGALGIDFGSVTVAHPIPLTQAIIRDLEDSVTLVHTGESRISGETITAVLEAYRERQPNTVTALASMAALAREMRNSIAAGNTSALFSLVNRHWFHQRSLHPRITTDLIDEIESRARSAGAVGFKALGASGGGCVIVCSSPENRHRIRRSIGNLGEILEWRVAMRGLIIERG